MQSFVNELRMAIWEAERNGVGVSADQLADKVHVSRQSIYAYRNGTTLPPNDVFDRLLDALEVRGARRGQLRTLRDQVDLARHPRRRARAAELPAGNAPLSLASRQLPARTIHFVGRDRELAELTALLDQGGQAGDGTAMIAVVSGAPGTGKTTLAVRWSHRVADQFPDGQLYIDLHGFDTTGSPTSFTDALRDFLESLGVRPGDVPATAEARAGMYRGLLAGRRVLVVLDNARDADQVQPLLPAGAGCMAIVTSRDPLGGLVARHGAYPVTLGLLSTDESTQLLERRLGATRLAAEPAAVPAIIDGCGRLPLALTVVATRAATAATESLGMLAAQLQDEQSRLLALDAGEPATDVRAAFAWSYRLLDDAAAGLFRLLGLAIGIDVGMLAAASLAGVAAGDARQSLRELVRTNLVQEPAPDRYAMHDLLQAYARWLVEREDTADARQAALTRLFDHYRYAAAAAMQRTAPHEAHRRPKIEPALLPSPAFTGAGQARAWLDSERRNLAAISEYAANNGWPRHAIDLSQILYRYLIIGGHPGDAELIHHSALRAARACGDPAAEGAALRNLGGAQWQLGRADTAIDHLRRAISMLTDLGDDSGAARAHNSLGLVYQSIGRQADATMQLEQAINAFHRAGDRAGASDALGNLGITYWLWAATTMRSGALTSYSTAARQSTTATAPRSRRAISARCTSASVATRTHSNTTTKHSTSTTRPATDAARQAR